MSTFGLCTGSWGYISNVWWGCFLLIQVAFLGDVYWKRKFGMLCRETRRELEDAKGGNMEEVWRKNPKTSERIYFEIRHQKGFDFGWDAKTSVQNQEIICRQLKCGVSTLLPWVPLLYLLTWATASSFRFWQYDTDDAMQSDFRECGIASGFDTGEGLFTFWKTHGFSWTKLQTVNSMFRRLNFQ